MKDKKINEPQPSKSEKKRQSIKQQKLGEDLIKFSKEELNKLNLPAALAEAIEAYKSMKDNEAKRRQRQFIGKLMRSLETETILTIEERLNF